MPGNSNYVQQISPYSCFDSFAYFSTDPSYLVSCFVLSVRCSADFLSCVHKIFFIFKSRIKDQEILSGSSSAERLLILCENVWKGQLPAVTQVQFLAPLIVSLGPTPSSKETVCQFVLIRDTSSTTNARQKKNKDLNQNNLTCHLESLAHMLVMCSYVNTLIYI